MNKNDKLCTPLLLLMLSVLIGCAPKKISESPTYINTDSFSYSGNQKIPETWWTVFEDQNLNGIIDSALQSNFNIKVAWERLQASQAIVKRESSGFFPVLDASMGGEINQPQSTVGNRLQFGLNTQYEVDLWGKIRSRVDAERYRAEASLYDYQSAKLSLTSEIARVWYQYTEAKKELQLIEEQIATNEKVMQLLRERYGSGQIRSVDILRQDQLLESTREQKFYVESRVHVLENQLAVLQGRIPQQEIGLFDQSLPEIPPLPQTGVPAELIQRRPDIQSAYNRLLAADKDLASAISNKYPRLSFSASATTAANNFNNLFNEWAYSAAGNLLAPIFYGGELKAEEKRANAVKNQRLNEYSQAVLIAFQEVEDALILERKQKESIKSIERQLELARKTYEQLRLEYFNGMSGYLDVLTALEREQQLQRSYLSAKLILVEYRINLYLALAGGLNEENN